MQALVAGDIRASRLVFITTAVVPGMLTTPGRSFYCPGTRSSSGTRTPGYPLTGLPSGRFCLCHFVNRITETVMSQFH